MRVADLPGRRRRRGAASSCARALGLAAATTDAPAFVRPDGEPIAAADLRHWLRIARLVRLSLETNGGICRSLLRVRYGLPDHGGGGRMKAARLHAYHEALKLDEVDEPKAAGPLDVVVKIGAAGPVPHRPAHPGGPVGREVRGRAALHARATRTRAGSTRSARA